MTDLTDDEKQWEEDDPDAIAPLNMVGYHVQIPPELALRHRTLGAYGMRPEPEEHAQRRREAWCKELDAYAKTFEPTMRVQPQPVTTDFIGFDAYWVIIFSTGIAGEDIESGRMHLHDGGYFADSITLYYSPAMA